MAAATTGAAAAGGRSGCFPNGEIAQMRIGDCFTEILAVRRWNEIVVVIHYGVVTEEAAEVDVVFRVTFDSGAG
ncbi:hypothetical protein CCAX7_55700 [Capsulimonas corticalis]|uniref:Uncharacterized protein n=1 Tax=Capsulimonas corticalis TaxID=2219043 RepID=A0A9N7QCK8_9BACT|nr:hypothetical protein CCAX7_55700 [Capsulimonas corticalis]